MILRKKFEELANGGQLRLAYEKHEIRIYKDHNKDLCGLILKVDNIEFKTKKYKGVVLSGDFANSVYLLSMTELDSNLHIFSALSEFVLERLTKLDDVSFDAIHCLVEEWRSFTQGRSEKLSASIQLGLFGELLFLQELITKKSDELGLISWTGPDKSKVDFIPSVSHAVEIKSSKDPLGNEVSISSLEQLSSDFEFHFLRRYGLVETLEGQTIKDLYYSIASRILDFELRDKFRIKAMDYGFNPYADYHDLLKLETANVVDYNVQDYSFPKIIPPLHEKVVKLQYTINLDSQESLSSDAIWNSLE
ncbi:MAG: PD-(D/E)XK motif protein [Flavobacteriales bacterium]|nr:PD-(D/E)XK motif protein [Flavobacteriales bacterium]